MLVFHIEAAPLRSALDAFRLLVERRNTIPILSTVRLTVDAAGVLVLQATDLDDWLTVRLDVQNGVGGFDAAADLDALRDFVRKLERAAVISASYDVESARLTLSAGRAVATLETRNASDFPAHPPLAGLACFNMPAADLSGLLASVAPAMSKDETRYYLKGAFLHADAAGRLAAAATCGHVLLLNAIDAPDAAAAITTAHPSRDRFAGLIVQDSSIVRLAKMIKAGLIAGEARVTFPSGRPSLYIEAGAVSYLAKAIDGTFPLYRNVIPEADAFAGRWNVDAADLVAFYKAGAPGNKAAGVAARYSQGFAIETSQAIDAGGVAHRTAPGTYVAAACEVFEKAFSPSVMSRALSLFAGPVSIDLNRADGASMITSEAAPHALALAMPIRVEYVAPVAAAAAPYEASFPGMAADVWNVTPFISQNIVGGTRLADESEIRAYVLNLVDRAGLALLDIDVSEMTAAAVQGLAAGFVIGARLSAVTYDAETKESTPAQYQDGAYSLLIPGGRRRGETVTLETVDETGAAIACQSIAMGKKGLIIEAAAVQDVSGLEPVKAARKAKRSPIVRPLVAPAPVEAEPVEQAAPVEQAPEPVETVEQAPPVDVPETVAEYAEPMPAAVEAVEQAPAIEPEPAAMVETAPEAAPEAPQDAPAPVDVSPTVDSLESRLARIEAALGLAPPEPVAKRSPAHAAAIRRAWSNRNALRLARKEAADAADAIERAANAEGTADSLAAYAKRLDAAAIEAIAQRDAARKDAADWRAIAEQHAARIDAERAAAAAERADLVATIDETRADLARESAGLEHNAARALRFNAGRRRMAAHALRLRSQAADVRAQRDGLAHNLQAMTARAAEDARTIAALRSTAGLVDQSGAPVRRFILESR